MPDRFYDNTRISAMRRCPRYFYFRHIRDWQPEGKSYALIFGSAWHSAMDSVWANLCKEDAQNLTTQEVADAGYEAFIENWMENGLAHPNELSPEDAMDMRQRNPGVALEMLYEYVEERRDFLSRVELLSIEEPFAVPLDPKDPSLFYVGRLDKVFKYKGQIIIGEHKTTSMYKKDGYFRADWIESFSPNSQIDGYLHAGHMLYGDQCNSVWVDAALVHKDIHDGFKFIPVERQTAQLDAWLWETRFWIDFIEHNADAQPPDDFDGSYYAAYPKNTNSCNDYAGCPYRGPCKMWADPSNKGTPLWFEISHWSPFDELGLANIGLKKET